VPQQPTNADRPNRAYQLYTAVLTWLLERALLPAGALFGLLSVFWGIYFNRELTVQLSPERLHLREIYLITACLVILTLLWRFLPKPSATQPTIALDVQIICGVVLMASMIASVVRAIDVHYGGSALYFPACDGLGPRDYYLFVLDCLAKGAILDFFESYHIDLYRCAPARHSFTVSTTVFLVRAFATSTFFWCLLLVIGWVRGSRSPLFEQSRMTPKTETNQ
jgi:hypothetical protein